jgi:hypothetical protein
MIEEVQNAVHRMKKGKAPGPDEIPTEYIKALIMTI